MLNHTVAKQEAGRAETYSKYVCVCLCVLYTYLESSVCLDNALRTGNAVTGSYRTGAVAEWKKNKSNKTLSNY